MSTIQKNYHVRAWLLSRPWTTGLLVSLLLSCVCFIIIKQRYQIRQREAKQLAASVAESLKSRLQRSASYNLPLPLLIDTSGRTGYRYQLSEINPVTRQEEPLLPVINDFSPYAELSFNERGKEMKLSVMPVNAKPLLKQMAPSLIISFILSFTIGLFIIYLVKTPARLQKMVLQQTSALEKSEKRNRAIVNALPDMAFVVDKNGWIIDYNNAYEPKPREQVIGKKVDEVMPDDIAQEFQSYLVKALSQKQLVTHSYQLNVENEARSFEARYVTQSNEDVLVMVRDITDTKKAEQRIKESEEKYRTLVEQAADSIFIADFRGSILVVNPAATKLSLYTEEELLRMKLYDFTVREELETMPFKFEEIAAGKTATSERKMRKKDGGIIDVEITAKIITPDRFLVFVRDITERKKANLEILKSREDLRKLTNYIENVREEERLNIAREIHDELGQQLTVLKMDVARLGKKITAVEEKCEPEINEILAAINKMVEVVRKISADLRPGLLDDLGLVAALDWYCADFSKKAGIRTSFIPLVAREDKLSQKINICIFRILQESLTNVARHSDASKVDISLVVREDQLVMLIEDNGKGFDPEELKDKKTLGIMGMKERVFMIGGIYNIYSTPGKGTIIEVVVPLNSKEFVEASAGLL